MVNESCWGLLNMQAGWGWGRGLEGTRSEGFLLTQNQFQILGVLKEADRIQPVIQKDGGLVQKTVKDFEQILAPVMFFI